MAEEVRPPLVRLAEVKSGIARMIRAKMLAFYLLPILMSDGILYLS